MGKLVRSITWQPGEELEMLKATESEIFEWICKRSERGFTTDLVHRVIFAIQDWPTEQLDTMFTSSAFNLTFQAIILSYLSIEPSHPFVWRLLKSEDEVNPSVGRKLIPIGGYQPVDIPKKRDYATIWFAGENPLLFAAVQAGDAMLTTRLLQDRKVFLHLSSEKQQTRLVNSFKYLDDQFFFPLMTRLFNKKLLTSSFGDPFKALKLILSREANVDEKEQQEKNLYAFFATNKGAHFKELREIDAELNKVDLDVQAQLKQFNSEAGGRKDLKKSSEKLIKNILNVFNYTDSFNIDRIIFNVIKKEFFDMAKLIDANSGLQLTDAGQVIFRTCLRSLANNQFFHHLKQMIINSEAPLDALDLNRVVCMVILAGDLMMLRYLHEMLDLSVTFRLASEKFDKGMKSGKLFIPEWQLTSVMKPVHPVLTALVLQRFYIFEYILETFGTPDKELEVLGLFAEEIKNSLS